MGYTKHIDDLSESEWKKVEEYVYDDYEWSNRIIDICYTDIEEYFKFTFKEINGWSCDLITFTGSSPDYCFYGLSNSGIMPSGVETDVDVGNGITAELYDVEYEEYGQNTVSYNIDFRDCVMFEVTFNADDEIADDVAICNLAWFEDDYKQDMIERGLGEQYNKIYKFMENIVSKIEKDYEPFLQKIEDLTEYYEGVMACENEGFRDLMRVLDVYVEFDDDNDVESIDF